MRRPGECLEILDARQVRRRTILCETASVQVKEVANGARKVVEFALGEKRGSGGTVEMGWGLGSTESRPTNCCACLSRFSNCPNHRHCGSARSSVNRSLSVSMRRVS